MTATAIRLGYIPLPNELRHLRRAIVRFAHLTSAALGCNGIFHLPDTILDALATLCKSLGRDGTDSFIRWYRDCKDEGRTGFTAAFYQVFNAMEILGESGHEPFHSARPFFPPLDWSKLPRNLRYLAGPAERYGKYQIDSHIDDFLARITPEEKAELVALFDEINRRDDWDAIDEWLSSYRLGEHKEAAYVYFFFGGVMDSLGLDPSSDELTREWALAAAGKGPARQDEDDEAQGEAPPTAQQLAELTQSADSAERIPDAIADLDAFARYICDETVPAHYRDYAARTLPYVGAESQLAAHAVVGADSHCIACAKWMTFGHVYNIWFKLVRICLNWDLSLNRQCLLELKDAHMERVDDIRAACRRLVSVLDRV